MNLFAEERNVVKGAMLSDDGFYRWLLTRTWGEKNNDPLLAILLNPSKADHKINDPTTLRLIHFARAWGHDGLVLGNLYAWRATDPNELLKARLASRNVVGVTNDMTLINVARGRRVLLAWGAHPMVDMDRRADDVVRFVKPHARELVALGFTKDGFPKHPLARGKHRVPDDTKPLPYLPRNVTTAS